MSSHDDLKIPEPRDIDRPAVKRQRLLPPVVQSDFRFDTIRVAPIAPVDSVRDIHCNIL